MLYKVSKKIACKVFDKDDKNLDEYIYGIELFFSSFVSTLLMLIIGICIDSLTESIVFMVSFSVLRIYTGGYHSKSFLLCNISTLTVYIINILVYKLLFDYIVTLHINIPIFIITLTLILFFAPVENENNPLERSQFIFCKIKAIIVMLLETIAFFVLLYVFKFESIAIMVPALCFVDILIAIGLTNNQRRCKNDKQKEDSKKHSGLCV